MDGQAPDAHGPAWPVRSPQRPGPPRIRGADRPRCGGRRCVPRRRRVVAVWPQRLPGQPLAGASPPCVGHGLCLPRLLLCAPHVSVTAICPARTPWGADRQALRGWPQGRRHGRSRVPSLGRLPSRAGIRHVRSFEWPQVLQIWGARRRLGATGHWEVAAHLSRLCAACSVCLCRGARARATSPRQREPPTPKLQRWLGRRRPTQTPPGTSDRKSSAGPGKSNSTNVR